MTNSRSKFTAFVNPKATSDNKLPNVTGQFALEGGKTYRFSAWANRSARDTLYMKGTHAPLGVAEALRAQIGTDAMQAPGPPDIDLKQGELVLFENVAKQASSEGETDADREKRLKRPDWHGYLRTADGWYQLAGWAQDARGKPGFIAGTATRYSAGPSADAEEVLKRPAQGRSGRGGPPQVPQV